MIRLVQRTLIIPRGDTGSFSIPQLSAADGSNTAVFTIFDPITHTKVFDKQVSTSEEVLTVNFTHFDTVNLPIGKYKWDIKFYKDPTFLNDELVDGVEVNSYYSAFSLPDCEIRQTGDSLLTAEDAPIATVSPSQLNIVSNLISELQAVLVQMQTNVSHYPKIVDLYWHVWDAENQQWVNTGIKAQPEMNEYVRHDELGELSAQDVNDIIDNN